MIPTQLLGFEKFIPPFANTNGSYILKDVNYASRGAGIRNETSKATGFVISLGLQLTNHRVIVSQIAGRLGSLEKPQQYLNKCFTASNAPCCPLKYSGECIPEERPCYNRSEYDFWDEFHPTEARNLLTAIRSYNSHDICFTYPMDIKHIFEHETKWNWNPHM
ncbi:hypothetical protein KIW84_015172 [Lathyrus oleraceus]|uniref:GDSL esterase/lipase n=1 Tax=Pisum sativum TaxID=3888 RepID=A0A9D5BPW2_PEA|nr:hypothetical protein KIW84_015172 [Pisum sativum]